MSRTEVDAAYQDALQLARAGDRARAIVVLTAAHAGDATHVGVRNALGVLRLETGDAAGAIALLKPLARELPGAAPILLNLGNALVAARRADDAIAPLRKATESDPENPAIWYGYARALQLAGRVPEAIAAYDDVLTRQPDHVEAMANRVAALSFVDRHVEADAQAQAGLAQAPDHAGLHFNRAMALLAQGQWAAGWAEYEWRERTTLLDGMRRSWTQPRWEGEPLTGRTILVHAEQGFGDTLQFVRWLKPLRTLAARVVFVAPSALVSLLQGSDVADQVVAFTDGLPPHDVQVPLTGLPHRLALHTDTDVMGAGAPYLRAGAVMDAQLAAWCAELPRDRLTVGLAWAGSATHVNDRHRSLSLGVLEPLLRRPDVTWVSLQTGERASDLAKLPRRIIVHDPTALLTSFGRTAQLVRQLDAVLTVDSAVAHLAGAFGRRCWLLLPRIGLDWRWAAEQQGRRWYTGVEPIRQQTPGEWREALQAVDARMSGLAAANEATSAGARNRQ